MGIVMRNILLCLMLGAGCSIYYETIVPVRVWRTAWVKYTAVPAFALGFLVIAFTEIPPYVLQPVRVIAVLWLVSWIYFQMKAVQSLILSVLFCAAMWIVTAIVVSAVYALPPGYRGLEMIEEELSYSVLLCLMLVFHFRYRKKISGLTGAQWARFGYFPIFSMIVIMAISMMMGSGDTERLVAVAGTATTVVSIHERMEVYDTSRVHKAVITRPMLDGVADQLERVPLAQRERIVGLDPGRAPVIVAGMVILQTVLDLAGVDSFTVSESDILHGIIFGRSGALRSRRPIKFATIGPARFQRAVARGGVAELAYAGDLKSSGFGLAGSSPAAPTTLRFMVRRAPRRRRLPLPTPRRTLPARRAATRSRRCRRPAAR